MKILNMEIESCFQCPLKKWSNDGGGFHYCGHISSPENHVIKLANQGMDEYYMPDWCPLEDC